MGIACTVGREVYPAMQGDEVIEDINGGGAYDVGVKNDLLHYMRVIGEKEVDAVLKVVIKIWRMTLSYETVGRDKRVKYKITPGFRLRCDCAHGWPYGHLPYRTYEAGGPSPRVDPVP
jgi:hypothetical protein